MRVSVDGLDDFDDMTEPTLMSDEDGDELWVTVGTGAPVTNRNLSLQVPSLADFEDALPGYSPTFPMYSATSLGES